MGKKSIIVNTLSAICVSASVGAAACGAIAETISGPATVIDGQTLEIGAAKLQLAGVLAPPLALECSTKRGKPYPCGRLARQALADIVAGKSVACTLEPATTARAAALATCRIGPFSLNELVIATGRVLAKPGVTESYDKAARSAQLLGEGLWKGRFPPPETWRPAP